MLSTCPLFLIIWYVAAQDFREEQKSHFHYKIGHLKEIPKRFEVKGNNVRDIFIKYIHDIEDLAAQHNVTVIYKVKVETQKPKKKKHVKNTMYKKNNSKKYNVPLKKKSMKLSNFEVLLRKLTEENGVNPQNIDDIRPVTTEKIRITSTKQIQLKFKPIVGAVKTNYTKIIKPVRNRIITLTS